MHAVGVHPDDPDEYVNENIEAFFADHFNPEPMFRSTLVENETRCLAKLQTL